MTSKGMANCRKFKWRWRCDHRKEKLKMSFEFLFSLSVQTSQTQVACWGAKDASGLERQRTAAPTWGTASPVCRASARISSRRQCGGFRAQEWPRRRRWWWIASRSEQDSRSLPSGHGNDLNTTRASRASHDERAWSAAGADGAAFNIGVGWRKVHRQGIESFESVSQETNTTHSF